MEWTERLQAANYPHKKPIMPDNPLLVVLEGIDFAGIFYSPDFDCSDSLDAAFAKSMIKTASMCLGGDACGFLAYVELGRISILVDAKKAAKIWNSPTDVIAYYSAIASSAMSLAIGGEAIFKSSLYRMIADEEKSCQRILSDYFVWRQHCQYDASLDVYCGRILASHELSQDGPGIITMAKVVAELDELEKKELLKQNGIDFSRVPDWQRFGSIVHIENDSIIVETAVPRNDSFKHVILAKIRAVEVDSLAQSFDGRNMPSQSDTTRYPAQTFGHTPPHIVSREAIAKDVVVPGRRKAVDSKKRYDLSFNTPSS